jgi:hypothetical protein
VRELQERLSKLGRIARLLMISDNDKDHDNPRCQPAIMQTISGD